jgi:hypothetical protein
MHQIMAMMADTKPGDYAHGYHPFLKLTSIIEFANWRYCFLTQ